MSEIRRDPLSGSYVIIAKNRANRPNEFEPGSVRRADRPCPFCAGNEEETPLPIAVYPLVDQTSNNKIWRVRVVPNKYPAVESNDDVVVENRCTPDTIAATGSHEVIIESPEHVVSFAELQPDLARLAFRAYRDRLQALSRIPEIKYAQVFKNAGAAAGASLAHVHSQLITLPYVPTQVQTELTNCRRFYESEAAGNCLLCAMRDEELAAEIRLVAATPKFAAFCPFASRFPYETWIVPRKHASNFETTSDDALNELSQLVQNVIARIEQALDRPAYNYLLHTAPFHEAPRSDFDWHFEVFPRLAGTAGFEWATGSFINQTPPEEAAAVLRDTRA